jgi:hypothetical protein
MRILFTLLISISFASWGQKAVYLHLNPKVNGVDLQLNTTLPSKLRTYEYVTTALFVASYNLINKLRSKLQSKNGMGCVSVYIFC